MRAWQLQGFSIHNLKLVETPIPSPGPNEVLVRMSAVSLNYRDKLVVEGLYSRSIAFPIIQGADGAGEVVQLGMDATRFRVNCKVYGELLDRLQIATDRALGIVAPMEFFQHPLA